ncbi:MAG TPA: class I SAM-dependent methyltransferase [Fimbriimonadaceae bacterium]|nr:class I SAM-dependent methyltransferase [Fimbriimonadaceae bacterium]
MTALQAEALELAQGRAPTPTELERVGQAVSPEAARWAFEQWSLRERAKAKFSRAAEMLFEREALEQATSEVLARYHAARFPEGVLVVDLTSGIGGDAMGLAERGPVLAFERNPVRAEILRHNLDLVDPDSVVVEGDALDGAWEFEYAIADPARRVGGRRTLDPEAFVPDPVAVANRMRTLKLGLIKLSPMLSDAVLEALGVGLEFVGRRGECSEVLVLCGSEAAAGRWAVLADTGERLEAGPMPHVGEIHRFLFDAHPCAVRAHALGALASAYDLVAVGVAPGYLTGPTRLESPWLRTYEVIEVLPFDRKRVKQRVRELGGRVQELKARGHRLDADEERKRLDPGGVEPLTIIVIPGESGIRAALCRRTT